MPNIARNTLVSTTKEIKEFTTGNVTSYRLASSGASKKCANKADKNISVK